MFPILVSDIDMSVLAATNCLLIYPQSQYRDNSSLFVDAEKSTCLKLHSVHS
jgi:hypothetical protein